MDDVGRVDLHDEGKPDLFNGPFDLREFLNETALEERKSVTPQDFGGLLLGHVIGVAILESAVYDLGDLFRVLQQSPDLSLPPFSGFLPLHVLDHGHHGPGGLFRKHVVRDTVLLEVSSSLRHIHKPHERTEDRFMNLPGDPGDDSRGFHDLRSGGGGQDDDGSVDPFVQKGMTDRSLIARTSRIPDDIHGVGYAGRGRKMLPELLLGLVRQGGKSQAGADQGVGGHDTGPPGIGDDGDPVPLGKRLHGEGLGIIKKLTHAFHPLDAALHEDGVIACIGTGKRPRMGCGRSGPLFGSTDLEGENGLAGVEGDFPGDFYEGPSFDNIFQIHDDDVRFRVVFEVSKKVDLVYVRLVSDAYGFGKPHVSACGKIKNGQTHGPGLGHQRNIAALGHDPGEAGIHPNVPVGIDDPQTIGAQEADSMGLGQGLQLLFPSDAVAAYFLEPGRDDRTGPDPFERCRFHGRGDMIRRNDDHRHIHFVRDIAQGRIGLYPLYGSGFSVYRVENPLVGGFDEISENGKTNAALAVCRPYDRNGPGPDQGIHTWPGLFVWRGP